MMKKILIKLLATVPVFFTVACANSQDCEGCWSPKFNFQLEEHGFIETMIFISGHSYALTNQNKFLMQQGKENIFCKSDSVGSKELIDILNSELTGIVTAEQVSEVIVKGLVDMYPCETK